LINGFLSCIWVFWLQNGSNQITSNPPIFFISGDRETSPKGGFPESLSPDTSSGRYWRPKLEKDYFLTYSNSSLKDNPSHLKSFVYEIISLEEPDEIHQDIDKYFDISDANLFLIENKEVDFREVSLGSFGTKSFLSFAKKIPYLERKRLIKEVCKEILSEEDLLLNYFVGVYDIAYQTVAGCECDVSCCHYDTKKK